MAIDGGRIASLGKAIKPTSFVRPRRESDVALTWHKKQGGFLVLHDKSDLGLMRRHFWHPQAT